MITERDMPHIQALQALTTQAEIADKKNKADAARDDKDNALKQLLQGNLLDSQRSLEMDKLDKTHQLTEQGAKNRLVEATDFVNSHPKMGVTLGSESAAITPKDNSLQMARLNQTKEEGYSKRLEKHQGFDSALGDIESLTNRDQKGGVLTNPDATLVSTGKVQSAAPTSLLGIGELLGAIPKGAAEERKALQRLQIEYQKASSGMRVTDAARQQEKEAIGYMASADPALVAKGVRALARLHQANLKTIGAGYSDEVRGNVNERLGGDPTSKYSVYDDAPQAKHPISITSPGRTVTKQMKNTKTGQIKTVYSDGTEEIN